MRKKRIVIGIILIIILVGAFFFLNETLQKTSFEVTPILFKIILDKGENVETSLSLKNLGEDDLFKFSVADLNKVLYLEKDVLKINKGETKALNISLSGLEKYGVYVGHISISNKLEEMKIPVIASIHTPNQLFAMNLNVASENKQLTKNDNLVTEINFFNLYDQQLHFLNLNYQIFDLGGEVIFSEFENVTIRSRTSFTKKFSLPENIGNGDYVFVVSLDYLNTSTTSNYLFSVVPRKSFSFFNIDSLAIIVVVFIMLTFFLILYVIHERKKLISRLKEQHKIQIKISSKGIGSEAKKFIVAAKTKKEKKKIKKEFTDAKKKILGELRKQHRKQIRELKELKNKKIKDKDKKFSQWRKQSYSNALKSAEISSDLKSKLVVLKNAYNEGFIKKKSYSEGVSELETADKKLKRNLYK